MKNLRQQEKKKTKMRPFNQEEGESFALQTKNKFFLGSLAGNHYNFKLSNRVNEIFPEIQSVDPRMFLLTERIVNKVEKLGITKKVHSNGFFDEYALTTDFRELNTVSGFNMSPATYAVIDNTILRSSMNLNQSFENSRHEAIFEEFMKVRYADSDFTQGKISRKSSSVFPFFSKNVELKANHLSAILSKGTDVIDAILLGKLEKVYDNYRVLLAMIDVYRSQADSFVPDGSGGYKSKPREVNDIEYSITGGRSGKRFVADKSIVVNGRLVNGKAAMRARTAFGLSNSINTVFTAGFEGYRHWSDNRFHKTYKHRSRAQIQEKINEYANALPVDVTQYDQSIPLYLVEKWIACSPFNEKARRLLLMLFNAPMMYRGVSEKSQAYWSGNPLDSRFFNQFKGLISGLFCTSAIGKDMFTFCSLTMLDDVYKDVLGNVEKILLWEHPVYAISNMGDDTNIHFNDDKFAKFVADKLEHSKYGLSPYFKVDIEDGFKFLGNVGYIDKDGKKKLCGDIGSYLSKMLVPERSITGKTRQFGVYGLLERREMYSDHPMFEKIDEIFLSSFRDVFREDWFRFMNRHLVLPSDKNVLVKTQADLEVMLDPTKLHYKYNAEDIDSTIIETIEEKISLRNTELATKLLMR